MGISIGNGKGMGMTINFLGNGNGNGNCNMGMGGNGIQKSIPADLYCVAVRTAGALMESRLFLNERHSCTKRNNA